jgi:hypothetical protein
MNTGKELLEKLELVEVQAPGPSLEVSERVWRGVEARLDGGGLPPPKLDDAPLFTEVSRSVALRVIVGIIGVLGIVGVAALARPNAGSERAPAVEPSTVTHADPPAVEMPPPADPPARAQPGPAPTPVDEPPPATPDRPKAKTKRPDPPSGSSPAPIPEAEPRPLTDEVALIEAMSRGLKQGAWKQVLALVAEHERDFRNGQFVEERRAAKARASCRAGMVDAGREEAAAFAARWPSSIHLPTVRQDCGL